MIVFNNSYKLYFLFVLLFVIFFANISIEGKLNLYYPFFLALLSLMAKSIENELLVIVLKY